MIRLLGEYLRANCNLTCHQIVIGLRQQVIMRDCGAHAPLGEVLVGLGFITEEQLAFALEQQEYDLQVLADAAQRPDTDAITYL